MHDLPLQEEELPAVRERRHLRVGADVERVGGEQPRGVREAEGLLHL